MHFVKLITDDTLKLNELLHAMGNHQINSAGTTSQHQRSATSMSTTFSV